MNERQPGEDALGAELTAWGKALRLETRGRHSGRTAIATLGYVLDDLGYPLVSAGDDSADWARNLEADPRCRYTLEGSSHDAIGELLGEEDHRRVIGELILRYGTPAERLGRGPSFRLRPP